VCHKHPAVGAHLGHIAGAIKSQCTLIEVNNIKNSQAVEGELGKVEVDLYRSCVAATVLLELPLLSTTRINQDHFLDDIAGQMVLSHF
jgi:hypothetical protein